MNKIYSMGDEEELAEDLQKELPNRIIAELEEIKANIDDLDRHFDNDYFSGNKESMFKCKEVFEILDKRISELKGENNETNN